MDLQSAARQSPRPELPRIWGILRELETAGIITLAGKAYQRAQDPVVTPYKGKNKPKSPRRANRSHAELRGPGERANAQLKSWKILCAATPAWVTQMNRFRSVLP
ncbi:MULTISPECIES: transposase family protein [Streptosporangium]|uniref:DDE Tnp4 domain-containing protein n=1 Tax=Streptosporangium brasiliense TaxID=47480 RepID=A0ABT9RES7_9ACTN|nr:hypothetical protein [Streptosporangium brasiliense]